MGALADKYNQSRRGQWKYGIEIVDENAVKEHRAKSRKVNLTRDERNQVTGVLMKIGASAVENER